MAPAALATTAVVAFAVLSSLWTCGAVDTTVCSNGQPDADGSCPSENDGEYLSLLQSRTTLEQKVIRSDEEKARCQAAGQAAKASAEAAAARAKKSSLSKVKSNIKAKQNADANHAKNAIREHKAFMKRMELAKKKKTEQGPSEQPHSLLSKKQTSGLDYYYYSYSEAPPTEEWPTPSPTPWPTMPPPTEAPPAEEWPTPWPTPWPTMAPPTEAPPTEEWPTPWPTMAPPTEAPPSGGASPCASEADFDPEAVMHGWCDFGEHHPEGSVCNDAGCSAYPGWPSGEFCHCEQQAPCEQLNGTYNAHTCADDSEWWPTEGFAQAREQGSCDGVTDQWGGDLTWSVDWPASKCCKNFPASVCNPDARKMTPCKDDADFMPDAPKEVWCDFGINHPSAEACQEAGCHHWEDFDGDRCWCEDPSPCEHLGGTIFTRTCGDHINEWSWQHATLQEAHAAGTCDGVEYPWGGEIESMVRHEAEKCCQSFPASICDPEARVMHPCASEEDFMPDASVWEYCEYFGEEPSYQECEAAGYCHCHTEDACAAFGGNLVRQTCGQEALHWDEGGQSLRQAEELGTCDGVMTSWGWPLVDEIDWPASMCCSSYPRNLCDSLPGANTSDTGMGDYSMWYYSMGP